MIRYFYFRNPSAITDDDNITDSLIIPVKNITGMQAPTDTTIKIYFESTGRQDGGIPGIIYNDSITLTTSSGKRKLVMRALAEATNAGPHHDGVMIIADDVTGTYLIPEIESVSAVSASPPSGAPS